MAGPTVVSTMVKRSRNKTKHNYTSLNKKGFASVKAIRVKKVAIGENGGGLAPASPLLKNSRVKRNLNKVNLDMTEVNKRLEQLGHDALKGEVFTPRKQSHIGANAIDDKTKKRIQLNSSDSDENFNSVSDLDMDKEECKRQLCKEITRMEAQLEEDDKLKALIRKQQELKKKLSLSGETPRKHMDSKKGKKVAKEVVSSKACEEKARDLDKEIKKGLPSVSMFQDMLHVSDKKTQKTSKN